MTAEEYKRSIHDHLLRAYMLSDEKIEFFLPRFLNTLQEHLVKLQQPLQMNNLKELRKAAHTLKGALLNLGLKELADIAYTIEKAAGAEHSAFDFQALYTQLYDEISSFTGADPIDPATDATSLNPNT